MTAPRSSRSSRWIEEKGRDHSRPSLFFVMPELVPGIHVFVATKQAVDGRVKPGHDGLRPSLRLGALRRRRRPRLDQRVVVDGLALRLLVGELALRRDVAVLGRLVEPVLSRLL